VFGRQPDGAWVQVAYLKASNAERDDEFANAVSVSGDTVVVGAQREDGDAESTPEAPNDNTANAGAAYVFAARPDGAWAQVAYLKAGNAGVGDFFGGAVSISGDTIAVGASGEDGDSQSTLEAPNNNKQQGGAVYTYSRQPDGGWAADDYIKASNTDFGFAGSFGASVCVSGDTLVVGAITEDGDAESTAERPNSNATDAGAAYVFARQPDGGWAEIDYLKASNADETDNLGIAVSVSGDTVVAGARYEDGDAESTPRVPNDNASIAGAAYVYELGE